MKRNLSLLALVSVIFFNVCGGPYALENVLNAGPGLALLLIVATPVLWGLPVALVCAELGTAIPEEGGYYAWSKRLAGSVLGLLPGLVGVAVYHCRSRAVSETVLPIPPLLRPGI